MDQFKNMNIQYTFTGKSNELSMLHNAFGEEVDVTLIIAGIGKIEDKMRITEIRQSMSGDGSYIGMVSTKLIKVSKE